MDATSTAGTTQRSVLDPRGLEAGGAGGNSAGHNFTPLTLDEAFLLFELVRRNPDIFREPHSAMTLMADLVQRSPEDMHTLLHTLLGGEIPEEPLSVITAFDEAIRTRGLYETLQAGVSLGVIR